ncbi:TIGR01777 family protein [Actinomadura logoneensis]|uniref:TIGR01777 family protein n=1 Tax=Actinomadura logoneensis TaxID=2293572 RepID=A0A372JQ55_9ACTN|nr:TIGR01777 family oxidoreductase [Actinomadura logoneensis]RFU42110.1 TIGR01777 family protein [Actinomadura logoneensis]
MKVAVTGASGFVGSALVRSLADDGHEVVRLVRREPSGPDERRWEPSGGPLDLGGVDAVVHLAGAGIGDRPWTPRYRRTILLSRVQGTATIARAVAEAGVPVLVSGSAIGFYGDTGDREVDEDAPSGAGFLAEVVRAWEAAASPASDAGARVAIARTGHVLGAGGGLLGKLLPLYRLGLGGRLGSGRQYWSWISLDDEVAALRLLIDGDLSGPVNLTAPNPVTNAEFTRLLGQALHRPTPLPVPAFALRAALPGFAREAILPGQRVVPRRLAGAGFRYGDPELGAAMPRIFKEARGGDLGPYGDR